MRAPHPASGRPTLAVIAERAGTSVPTVSKALRGGTDVAPATRERVLRVASELGYLATGGHSIRNGTDIPRLVHFVLETVEGSWANRALGGFEAAARAADLDVVITLGGDPGWVARVLRQPSVGAVLAVVDPTQTQWRELAAQGFPIVLLDPMSPPPREVPSVGAMNWQGGRSAAEHLVELGHTRIAVIDVERSHEYSRARVDGFRAGLAAAGIEIDATNIAHAGWSRSRARVAAQRILSAGDAPTAFFTCTEALALGVYDAAAEAGLSIPGDLSVVGFDDLPEASQADPPMTTVQQPIAEMGAAALRMLLRITEAPTASDTRAMREELATRLIVRSSTGFAPGLGTRTGPLPGVAAM